MPIFDLQCNDCNKEFQKLVSYSKLKDVECPQCGGTNNRRLYTVSIKGPITAKSSSNTYSPPRRGFT